MITLLGELIMRNIPKTQESCPVGIKKGNIGRGWYEEEKGSFCSHCLVKFSFDETLKIYLMNKQSGMRHGIPRCLYCGRTLRTRPKKKHVHGFWEKLEEMQWNAHEEVSNTR